MITMYWDEDFADLLRIDLCGSFDAGELLCALRNLPACTADYDCIIDLHEYKLDGPVVRSLRSIHQALPECLPRRVYIVDGSYFIEELIGIWEQLYGRWRFDLFHAESVYEVRMWLHREQPPISLREFQPHSAMSVNAAR
ncbi:MAG: hypothetical protein GYB68_06535 [Chloroflexi bacterium]|nr:hypothetical protein [Chloroflexota bacterium]